MHRRALRAANGRVRVDASQTAEALNLCIRRFSTTQLRPQPDSNDSSDRPKPTGQERSRAAANEIGQLVQTSSGSGAAQRFKIRKVGGGDPAENVVNLRSVPRGLDGGLARKPGDGQASSWPARRSEDGKAVGWANRAPEGARIAGLPTSFRGRALGARSLPAGFSEEGPAGLSGFGRGGGQFARGRGGGGTGRGGTRGGRGGRGGRGRGNRGRRRDDGDGSKAMSNTARADAYELFFRPENDEEKWYVTKRDKGLSEHFTPVVTLESLAGYGPPIATDANTGVAETVVQNLRALSDNRIGFWPEQWNDITTSLSVLKQNGKFFFDDIRERKFIELHLEDLKEDITKRNKKLDISEEEKERKKLDRYSDDYWLDVELSGPTDAVKTAILNTAVKGRYEAPQFAPNTDHLGIARSIHIRNETYLPKDVIAFEEKLGSLLPAPKAPAQAAKSV